MPKACELLSLILAFMLISSAGCNNINLSVILGEKQANENNPLLINISTPDDKQKKGNIDLICVIDNSGSMKDENKIEMVKESLVILTKFLDSKDRLGIVLFNSDSQVLLNLMEMNDHNKKIVIDKVDDILAGGGTNILSGLGEAVKLLHSREKSNKISGIFLLSDGLDNNYGAKEITRLFKERIQGTGESFTLHTFGYGRDHDPDLMSSLAHLRDGSFYYVEKLDRVKYGFVDCLGGVMSVVYKDVEISVTSMYKLSKVFGMELLHSVDFQSNLFKTSILQFISGKEYSYVLELIGVPQNIPEGIILATVQISYTDLKGNRNIKKVEYVYSKSNTSSVEKKKLQEEYFRAMTYDVLGESIKLGDKAQYEEAKEKITAMKLMLLKYPEPSHERDLLISQLDESYSKLNRESFMSTGKKEMTETYSSNTRKQGGSSYSYSNALQKAYMDEI